MEERNDRLIRWVLGLLLPWRRREVCAYAVRQYLAPATVKLCSFVVVGTDSEHVFSKTHEPTVITTTATGRQPTMEETVQLALRGRAAMYREQER